MASAVLVPSDESLLRQIFLQCDGDCESTKSLEGQVSACLVDEGFVDNDDEDKVRSIVLLRPQDDGAGLYAFFVVNDNNENSIDGDIIYQYGSKNIKATRLAMACGLFAIRFYGPVILLRSTRGGKIQQLKVSEVEVACCVSPDLRLNLLERIKHDDDIELNNIPDWIAQAAKQNYHDQEALDRLAKVMSMKSDIDLRQAQGLETYESSRQTILDILEPTQEAHDGSPSQTESTFVARSPLCLNCRRPCQTLCPNCHGAYFCDTPSHCSAQGWSHDCLCATWKVYVDRRLELSVFDGLGDWYEELVSRTFQVSDRPYRQVLDRWGISNKQLSWWRTETDGWMGGTSAGAQAVNVYNRLTYREGFAPFQDVPPERPVSKEDVERIGSVESNSAGMLILSSWEQYYKLRELPASSPLALLLSFPLTLYHAIALYGQVPATAASMLRRPIRIHLVGVEKELNFLDLFKEVGFLLPQGVKLELVFVVREDMIPKKDGGISSGLRLQLTTNLTLMLVTGTYGESLDPNFDCGSGPPDMVIGMNAGLFAYESWRSVVSYLYHSPNVVGVFTDYNEHSGVNCASLGGRLCRQSLQVNPFRQPRAMPVYSMNLPQFSNGFYYVFNEQLLE